MFSISFELKSLSPFGRMDICKRINTARRTICPALTPSLIPNFYIPPKCNPIPDRKTSVVSSSSRKTNRSFSRLSVPEGNNILAHPDKGSSLPGNTKAKHSQSVYDDNFLGGDHLLGSVCIDSHVESVLDVDSTDQMKYEVWSDSDPGMKLSMTLDHIPKVTTPYGFRFLQHSPSNNVRREKLLLSTNFRNRTRPLLPSVGDIDPSCLNDKKEECSVKAVIDASGVKLTSETTVSSSESLAEGQCKTEVQVSESSRERPNSIQVSTSLTYQTPLIRYSSTKSISIYNPLTSTTATINRIWRTPKMSVDIDRLNAINKLHMLCVRQLFEASTRDLGEIELALQYDRRRRRLRVRVRQANGVGLRSASRKINTHVRLCLMPDKQNPQQTRLVKGTCDPTYNEEFFFNVSPFELISSGLKVRVFQSSVLLLHKWHASCVGEVLLNLEKLKDTTKEIFFREDLKPKAAKEVSIIV